MQGDHRLCPITRPPQHAESKAGSAAALPAVVERGERVSPRITLTGVIQWGTYRQAEQNFTRCRHKKMQRPLLTAA